MSSSSKTSTRYCSICDKYFFDKYQLHQHLNESPRHPHCDTCNRSFLNNNSLKTHWIFSNRHFYCTDCDKMFSCAAALEVHLDESKAHGGRWRTDRYRQKGWEEEIARARQEEARRKLRELPIDDDEDDEREGEHRMSIGELEIAIQRMKLRPVEKKKGNKTRCPVCFRCPKDMSVTLCGHVFCSSCINLSFEQRQGCPSCRKPGYATQLRTIHIRQ